MLAAQAAAAEGGGAVEAVAPEDGRLAFKEGLWIAELLAQAVEAGVGRGC